MRPRNEQGFTLVELIIVLVIVAILMAVAMSSFGNSKDAANRGKVILAAQTYDQAMSSFASDHMGKVPTPRTADWPEMSRGPLEPATRVGATSGQAYMRSIPETVTDGTVTLQVGSPAPSSSVPGKVGVVAIVLGPTATTYRIEVWPSRRGALQQAPTCQLGTLDRTGVKQC